MKHGSRLPSRVCVAILSLCVSASAQQPDPLPQATPVDPVTAIIDAFRSHAVVALDEGDHGNEQSHAFRLALIRDPRFSAAVNDIVVEFGNSRYQDVMDRFIRGDEVPDEAVRRVWQNTTQPGPVWDSPIYEEFLGAVRTVNASRSPDLQLRVLLGDPPLDWENVHGTRDLVMGDRDGHPADVIRREVLAKGRRALVIYGGLHLLRKDPLMNYESARTIISLLESEAGTKSFTVWTDTAASSIGAQGNVASWPRPSLALIHETLLGAKDFTFYYPFNNVRVTVRDGTPVPVPRERWRSLPMENQFDAVLYLGPRSAMTTARLSRSRCTDRAYMEMRLWRMGLMPGSEPEIDRLKRYCAGRAPR